MMIICLAFTFEASAQSCHVVYTYDSAGNRVQQFKISPVPWASVGDADLGNQADGTPRTEKTLARIDTSAKLSAEAVPLKREEESIQRAGVLPDRKEQKDKTDDHTAG